MLDWVRFAAASTVVIVHSGVGFGLGTTVAVQVFFALSGWLIGAILLRTDRAGLPRFFYKRSTRIWIPYAVAIVLLYGLALALGRGGQWPDYLLHDVTFTHNWFVFGPDELRQMPLDGTGNHFWSIGVEEQFYLLAPLIMIVVPFGKRVSTWVAVSAIAIALAPIYFGAISLGVLAAVVNHRYPDWYLTAPARAGLVAGAVLTGVVVVAADDLYVYAVPFFSVAVVLLAAVKGRRRKVATFLGATSYPLYLNHWIGLFAANRVADTLQLPDPGRYALGYALAVMVGIAAYLAVDRNVLAHRDRFFSRRLGLTLAVVGYVLVAVGFIAGLALAPGSFPVLHEG